MEHRDVVVDAFRRHYRCAPTILVRAPGRANLIGEHTDYNDGFVMPMAIHRAVLLAAAQQSGDQVQVCSLDYGSEVAEFSSQIDPDAELPHWARYVGGAWWLLRQRGVVPPGAKVMIGGDIPIGVGMSSSAALGVAVIELVLALTEQSGLSQADKALLAVELEHEFLGTPCGVMDQMASASGIAGHAMLLDCRSLEITPVSMPDQAQVVIINSGKSRALASSAYAERRRQCEQAAAILGVSALRDATLDMIEAAHELLGPILSQRARHVVTENNRTLQMHSALASADLAMAGNLLNRSHTSLRDDYAVSVWEMDQLVQTTQQADGCFGARMMGGGFGGCAVSLVEAAAVDAFIEDVGAAYEQVTELRAEFYVCAPGGGSHVQYLETG
ncbi:MAG: galactokinase [Chloroflexi bacterium]|nr:galactokinase [Chloroflexota bacterium]